MLALCLSNMKPHYRNWLLGHCCRNCHIFWIIKCVTELGFTVLCSPLSLLKCCNVTAIVWLAPNQNSEKCICSFKTNYWQLSTLFCPRKPYWMEASFCKSFSILLALSDVRQSIVKGGTKENIHLHGSSYPRVGSKSTVYPLWRGSVCVSIANSSQVLVPQT